MDTLTPNDLFSPSKARQHRAQAQEWAAVESWLSTIYAGRSVPTFERNDETLKALLALAAANERADAEFALVEKVEGTVLSNLRAKADVNAKDIVRRDVLDAFSNELSKEGAECIDALARTATVVDTSNTDLVTIAHRLVELTSNYHDSSQQLLEVERLHSFLEDSIVKHREDLKNLKQEATATSFSALNQQTADRVRMTKQLRPKLQEYEARAGILPIRSSSKKETTLSLQDLIDLEKEISKLEVRAAKQIEQPENFRGLPTDLNKARKAVKGFEDEVDKLRKRREELFEKIGV